MTVNHNQSIIQFNFCQCIIDYLKVKRAQMLLPAATLLLGLADPEVHRYLEYMKNMMRLYDVSPSALEHADDILDLEISLAVVSIIRIYVYSMFLSPSSHFFEKLKIN